MNEERVMEFWSWNFPGGGWTLAALALMLILLVGLSYAFPRHRITRGKKILLASLRILFFAGVLFCAMDLRRVEERTFEKEVKRKETTKVTQTKEKIYSTRFFLHAKPLFRKWKWISRPL